MYESGILIRSSSDRTLLRGSLMYVKSFHLHSLNSLLVPLKLGGSLSSDLLPLEWWTLGACPDDDVDATGTAGGEGFGGLSAAFSALLCANAVASSR